MVGKGEVRIGDVACLMFELDGQTDGQDWTSALYFVFAFLKLTTLQWFSRVGRGQQLFTKNLKVPGLVCLSN